MFPSRSFMLGVGLAALTGGSVAAQGVTLRIADSLPVGHYTSQQGILPWIAAIDKQSGGAVKMEYYPASQLGQGKDLLALTQSGVVDIALIQPAYVSEKLPLSGIMELPSMFRTSCVGTKAFWETATGDGLLAQAEYDKQKVRVLFGAVLAPYQLLMRDVPIETVEQLQGAKIRTGGGTQDVLINKLGGVPVRIPGPEIYESLSRGTADGVILPLASVLSYDVQKLVKYSTLSSGFGTTVTAYMISEDRWKTLSPQVQQVLAETGREASMQLCAYIDGQTEGLVAKLREAGVQIVSLPDAEQAKMDAVLSEASAEWAAGLDARGLPATELLKVMGAAAAQ